MISLNTTDRKGIAENNSVLVLTVCIIYPGCKGLFLFHLKQFCWNRCVSVRSQWRWNGGISPSGCQGVSAVYIPHIPAANWIRTMAFLVESSFIVLLESYMDGGLFLLSHALLFGLWVCFFTARGSFIRFWLHVGNKLKMTLIISIVTI